MTPAETATTQLFIMLALPGLFFAIWFTLTIGGKLNEKRYEIVAASVRSPSAATDFISDAHVTVRIHPTPWERLRGKGVRERIARKASMYFRWVDNGREVSSEIDSEIDRFLWIQQRIKWDARLAAIEVGDSEAGTVVRYSAGDAP